MKWPGKPTEEENCSYRIPSSPVQESVECREGQRQEHRQGMAVKGRRFLFSSQIPEFWDWPEAYQPLWTLRSIWKGQKKKLWKKKRKRSFLLLSAGRIKPSIFNLYLPFQYEYSTCFPLPLHEWVKIWFSDWRAIWKEDSIQALPSGSWVSKSFRTSHLITSDDLPGWRCHSYLLMAPFRVPTAW